MGRKLGKLKLVRGGEGTGGVGTGNRGGKEQYSEGPETEEIDTVNKAQRRTRTGSRKETGRHETGKELGQEFQGDRKRNTLFSKRAL